MTDIRKHHVHIVTAILNRIDDDEIAGVEAPGACVDSAGTWTGIPITVTRDDGTQAHYTLGVELSARTDQEARDDDQ